MCAHLDAIGNVCGRYEGERPGVPCLMLGSHYDTVRDAGKWDGPLGLITAISCVADLNRRGQRLPFAIEMTVLPMRRGCASPRPCWAAARWPARLTRASSTHATAPACPCARRWPSSGSIPIISARPREPAANSCLCRTAHRAGAGAGTEEPRRRRGLRDCRRDRLAARLTGMAGHAGTVPMALRRDALAGAAECIGAVEEFCRTDEDGLVGTVGYIQGGPARPTSSREGVVHLDMRAPTDMHRKRAVAESSGRSKPSPGAANCRFSSTSPTRTAPRLARPG